MKKPLFVIDKAFDFLPIKPAIQAFGFSLVFFSDFQPNPSRQDVEKGLKVFEDNHCDSIVSIGGGTALDIGKNIKHLIYRDQYSLSLEKSCDVAYQDLPNVPMIAIPTTSGTGSESTHFAVEYLDGIKHSNAFPYLLPNYVFLFPDLTYSVPLFQKKCTMMDAFCQCIESTWSKKATKQSQRYAKKGIALFLKNYQGVLSGDKAAMAQMQIVANCSGKAINISETTAAHALSYSLTTDFHIPHGQAVSILLPLVWEENNKLSTQNSPWRVAIGKAFDGKSSEKALLVFRKVFCLVNNAVDLPRNTDINILCDKVNIARLSNNPEDFSRKIIKAIYQSLEK
jgi:alcohol dehydrogenase class IV